MEGILSQRVSPLLKCVVLFLFIFTAKVLTTRPQEPQDGRNSIHQPKSSHFVRTFTKYHHRRTIQWNQEYWPSDDHPNAIQKRNIEIPYSNNFIPRKQVKQNVKKIVKRNAIPNTNEFINSGNVNNPLSLSDSLRDNFEKTAIADNDNRANNKNGLSNDKNSFSNEVQKYKVKPAYIPTSSTTTQGPTISCIYKTNSISMSPTPSYDDDKNSQFVVENDNFEIGSVSVETLSNGETVQVEQCTDSRAYCYTLLHQDRDGNVTVLGQGCWRSSSGGCGGCTSVTPLLPAKFCCCPTSYCNHGPMSLEEETVTMKAESPVDPRWRRGGYSGAALSAGLAGLALLVAAAALHTLYCRRPRRPHHDTHLEKVDVMGSGPDALATGLLCVDNLILIEHIGQGKFGSVWRGSLGGSPVAVKLYSNTSAWQKEAAIYALPHLSHPNLLRYYGSDSRATSGGGREQLMVLELCEGTLRSRLQAAPLSWPQFAHLAHGIASALAHLHSHSGSKPCVVHRDVNSNNVLIVNSSARLADLGLAQVLPAQHTRIAEAGTLRYLSPEALEGALDLSEARAALCAVDVFALALVLWEMLWRCAGAHPSPSHVPPYCPPYHLHLSHAPTLAQMQSVVSRGKARPPLPRGPVAEPRALRLAADTCDECWDHDAEARLTAVCVEERMLELKQMLQTTRARTHDNLHTHPPPENHLEEKNSNCRSQQCGDVTNSLPAPLPPLPAYPAPHVGRNACIQRNTHTHAHTPTNAHTHLVHRSLKDLPPANAPAISPAPASAPPLSVARDTRPTYNVTRDIDNSERLNEIRSHQRPIDYVANDVSVHDKQPKQTNLLQENKDKTKWGIRRFLQKRLGKNKLETEVKLVPEHSGNNVHNGKTKTSLVNGKCDRPTNLLLDQERNYNFEVPCTLSPPNRTLSPTMLMESHQNRENRVFGFKELPSADENKTQNQIFAVIVPKAKPTDYTNLIELQNKHDSSDSVKNSIRTSMSSQSFIKSGHSESEDSTVKKRLSCDNKILNSGRSSRASINLELQYIDNNRENYQNDSPYDLNSDCSSSEDEQLMLLSENGGSKITMHSIPKPDEKKKYHSEVLKECHKADVGYNYQNRYKNFDNEFSDPNDKENLINGYSVDNPVYIAALNGEINTTDLKILEAPKSPKPCLKSLVIKRQHSLEQVSEIFSSAGEERLQHPAGRVKTPGDLPPAVRRARRDRAARGRQQRNNRLSLYDDRMMFGNSL